VNVSLGQEVSAGQIIATLENSAERAALTQAEGSYEAALANSDQSSIGVSEADTQLSLASNNAITTFKSAYNTANGIVKNSIDAFFSNPDSSIPGLRIAGRGFTEELNNQRVQLQSDLTDWNRRVQDINENSDLVQELAYANNQLQFIIGMVDNFITVFNQQSSNTRYSESELKNFGSEFTGYRSELISTQANINSAVTSLRSAEAALERANLNASGSNNSSADAQIKQALGSLQAAQANYNKTILRTPIAGEINSLSVRSGDFVGAQTEVAKVANNNGLEITTFLNDSERDLVQVGDEVLIENEFTGTITNISPAIDPATGKTEVIIATEGTAISNGDTVRITKEFEALSQTETVIIPLTAIKFDRDNGSIFIVEDSRLISRSIELGDIFGTSVEVINGLDSDEEFVLDARGLVAGDEVTINN
jgi:multidrug resistance efflux pump